MVLAPIESNPSLLSAFHLLAFQIQATSMHYVSNDFKFHSLFPLLNFFFGRERLYSPPTYVEWMRTQRYDVNKELALGLKEKQSLL